MLLEPSIANSRNFSIPNPNGCLQCEDMTVIAQLHNAIDYPLRQLFRWGRGGLRWRNESKAEAYAQNPAATLESERLLQTYDLGYFAGHSRTRNYRENLYYLALLERALSSLPTPTAGWARAADIGASDWFYVHALFAFLKRHQTAPTLIGYEADAYRVYNDLHSRQDYAQAYMRGLPAESVVYEPRAFVAQPAAFDLVTLFFPFVFERDHLAWGLPRGLFRPQSLLASAWASLRPGGALMIVNQGADEHAAQQSAFSTLGIPIHHAARFESPLFFYQIPRYLISAQKPVD